MRTSQIATLIATAGLAAGGCMVAAQSASSATSVRHAATQRFVLVDHTGRTEFNDVRPAGISVGDSFTFSEDVTRSGKRVGFAGGVCTETAVSARSTSQLCTITAVLSRGQLVVSGIATYPTAGTVPPAHYAITGGTGAFRTARGQLTVTPIKEGSDRIVVELG
jgi:hypothetical protein